MKHLNLEDMQKKKSTHRKVRYNYIAKTKHVNHTLKSLIFLQPKINVYFNVNFNITIKLALKGNLCKFNYKELIF